MIFRLTLATLAMLPFAFSACAPDEPDTTVDPVTDAEFLPVLQQVAAIAFQKYSDSAETVATLESAIGAFLLAPSQVTLTAARQAWLDSNEPYGQTEVFRFNNGPIEGDPANGAGWGREGSINAWPLDENLIDYVVNSAGTAIEEVGIIQDVQGTIYGNGPYTIDKALIDSLNEFDGSEENVASGYHAIEFLLWGQDLNEQPGDAGLRTADDFIDGNGPFGNEDRRRDYLREVTDLLSDDLDDLVTVWDPNSANTYVDDFTNLSPQEGLFEIMVGMGSLTSGELAGERMFVAYDTQDQENEHSCFSDNTLRDIATNFQGVANLYYGSYTDIEGQTSDAEGIEDLVVARDSDLDQRIRDQLTQIDADIQALENNFSIPFDEMVQGSSDPDTEARAAVFTVIDGLRDLADLIAEAAALLNVDLNTGVFNADTVFAG